MSEPVSSGRLAVATVAALGVTWVCARLARFKQQNKLTEPAGLLEKILASEASEDAAVRVRFTDTRLKKAVAVLPAGFDEKTGLQFHTDEFDVCFIGGGLGSLACAAALSRMGKTCCVLEQGEQLGGGAHVFSEPGGYEFETGVVSD